MQRFGGLPPKHGQRRFIKSTDQYLRLLEASGAEAIAFHSLRAVTPQQMARVSEAGRPGDADPHPCVRTDRRGRRMPRRDRQRGQSNGCLTRDC
jgi:hypothetical protein